MPSESVGSCCCPFEPGHSRSRTVGGCSEASARARPETIAYLIKIKGVLNKGVQGKSWSASFFKTKVGKVASGVFGKPSFEEIFMDFA